MTAPLSGPEFQQQVPGIGAAVRDRITPRGSYSLPEDSVVYRGDLQANWEDIPAMYSTEAGFGGLSTVTGVPLGTPEAAEFGKKQMGDDRIPSGDTTGGVTY